MSNVVLPLFLPRETSQTASALRGWSQPPALQVALTLTISVLGNLSKRFAGAKQNGGGEAGTVLL